VECAIQAARLALVRAVLTGRSLAWVRTRLHRTDRRGEVSVAEGRRAAVLIHLAAGAAPWRGNCLHRSVVLWWTLQRRGTDSQLQLGVRAVPSGPPDFHAWVELDGRVLNDRFDIRDVYEVLTDPAGERAWRTSRTSAAIASTSSGNRSRSEA
jgi:hypothetical protein